MRRAVVTSMLALGLSSVATSIPLAAGQVLAPQSSVRRLGSLARHVTVSGVTKEALEGRSGTASVGLPALEAGTLRLAVTIVPGQDKAARTRFRCAASSSDDSALGEMSLDTATPGWTEVATALPGTTPGHLRLACTPRTPGVEIAWARPIFVPAKGRRDAPLIVLISLDTLRADHVAGFGAEPDLTPALERIGREGIRFVNATAESTWTLPSHFSLFYSRLYGFPWGEGALVGLVRALADHGFATVGLTGGGFVSATFMFHLGFDHYVSYDSEAYGGSDVRALPAQLEEARRWIDEHAEVPLFVFLHTYAVHELTPVEAAWVERQGEALIGRFEASPAQLARARTLYRSLVRQTDAHLAPFVAALRELAETRRVLLVVLSDHGEAFGEHANYRHGSGGPDVTLHDEVVRIPLIVWGPGLVDAGRVSRRPTTLIDVAPSLLEAVGAEVSPRMVGTGLWSLWSGARGARPPRDPRGGLGHVGARWALRTATRKLIMDRDHREHVELYDLTDDPGEQRNLASRHPRAVRVLRDRLASRLQSLAIEAAPTGPLPECPLCGLRNAAEFWNLVDPRRVARKGGGAGIDDATRERLRALGYVHP